jgi:hypothetical protein
MGMTPVLDGTHMGSLSASWLFDEAMADMVHGKVG